MAGTAWGGRLCAGVWGGAGEHRGGGITVNN